MAVKPRAASTEHLETVQPVRTSSKSPKGKVWVVCVCTCVYACVCVCMYTHAQPSNCPQRKQIRNLTLEGTPTPTSHIFGTCYGQQLWRSYGVDRALEPGSQIFILILPLLIFMTSGKILYHSVPQFYLLQNEGDNSIYLLGLL